MATREQRWRGNLVFEPVKVVAELTADAPPGLICLDGLLFTAFLLDLAAKRGVSLAELPKVKANEALPIKNAGAAHRDWVPHASRAIRRRPMTLEWHANGDPGRIRELLALLPNVGEEMVPVSAWRVTREETDRSLEWDTGELMRPIALTHPLARQLNVRQTQTIAPNPPYTPAAAVECAVVATWIGRLPARMSWTKEGEVVAPRPEGEGTAVQSVRFTTAEMRAVRAAAARADVTTSEFIRQAAVDASR